MERNSQTLFTEDGSVNFVSTMLFIFPIYESNSNNLDRTGLIGDALWLFFHSLLIILCCLLDKAMKPWTLTLKRNSQARKTRTYRIFMLNFSILTLVECLVNVYDSNSTVTLNLIWMTILEPVIFRTDCLMSQWKSGYIPCL